MHPYKEIFSNVVETLKEQSEFTEEEFNENFDRYKTIETMKFSDNDYYVVMVDTVFYSGMRANVVSSRKGLIRDYFHDITEVCSYDDVKLNDILNDEKMIKNEAKIRACINNAKMFKEIINEYGSFDNYINSFKPRESLGNILVLRQDLINRFSFIGDITSFHFMTDVGLPVLKPDRVMTRIFKRLGLIQDENQLLETVIQGLKFSEETGLPIRYIDIMFVNYGQMGRDETIKLDDGICLEKNPKCDICGIREYCEESYLH